ncbi:MAG: hypothetical protein N3E49_04250 [Bacteroidia bacterium]|nr:hypothetical protein [Bacteroidia bacterium]
MALIWLQSVFLGLTSSESRAWKQWANDTSHWDSVLRSWGYWAASPKEGRSGPKFRLMHLLWEGDTGHVLSSRIARKWERRVLTSQLLVAIPIFVQRRLLDQGFLYSTVRWRRLHCDSVGECTGVLSLELGPQVRLDTVIIRGKWNAPRSALYQITGLRPGQPLRLSQWETFSRRLRNSPYATLVDTPQLWLFPHLAWIEVTLKPKAGNRIDGALSILPSTTTGRTQLIGHAELVLLSPFRLGEKVEARFAQLPGSSQRLNLLLSFPYLLRGYVETQGSFTLWRQDTSFLTREAEVKLRYRLTPSLSVIGGYQTMTSRLLSTAPYRERVWPPPPVLDFRRQGFRIGWQYDQVDFRLAPRQGWQIELIGTQGRRGYLPNPALSSLAYERLPPPGPFQELSGALHRYTPIGRFFSLHLGIQAYRYLSQGSFENELLRAGGSKSLRGFPENTFPTAGYLHLLGEPRLHIDEESYLAVFFEGTLIDLFRQGEKTLQAAGLLLQTRLAAGLLQVTFAAGRVDNTPWDLRRALVRLEWISEF